MIGSLVHYTELVYHKCIVVKIILYLLICDCNYAFKIHQFYGIVHTAGASLCIIYFISI